ncbi:MAG: hypothetical protein FWF22_01615 [Treponema sp.]|nr:hypothetical protein [Treponema sp.]
MKIKYVHHSGFILEDAKCSLMIDCCGLTGSSPELLACAGKPLYILASHIHGDHFDNNILSFGDTRPAAQTKWILSDDIRKKIRSHHDAQFLAKGGTYRDDLVSVKAYGSTDIGISFYIETVGLKIFHAGDLNNWHWRGEETPADAAKNEQAYLKELELIAQEVPALDAAMFPVDPRLGKDYALGAQQFLDKIKTGLFIPMHFWDNYSAALAFKPEAESRGCRFAEIRTPGDVFVI